MRSLKAMTTGLALVSTLSACAPMAASFKQTGDVGKKDIPVDKTLQLQCLDNQPDYILKTDILYFQMTDKFGVKVGVNLMSGLLQAIGLGVQYASGELSTAMHLYQPLNTAISVSDRPGTATAKSIGFDAGFGISILNLGFSYYTTTSLAALSESAMRDNLTNIVADIKDEWTTHVSNVYNASEIEIPVGYKAGIQAGDQFAIYEVEWEFVGGAPCQGPLKIARRLSADPMAIATVSQQPSASTSILITKMLKADKKVSMYDLVAISKLGASNAPPVCTTDFWGNTTCQDAPERTGLNRSIRLGNMTGNPILFDTGNGVTQKVDITPFASKQLTTIVNDPTSNYGMYLLQ